jgi:hypothetical protein
LNTASATPTAKLLISTAAAISSSTTSGIANPVLPATTAAATPAPVIAPVTTAAPTPSPAATSVIIAPPTVAPVIITTPATTAANPTP